MTTANSKRIAKNTFFMYVRMVLNVILALYTSKLLLKYLGVSDFGIYNLVGSVIAAVSMFKLFSLMLHNGFLILKWEKVIMKR